MPRKVSNPTKPGAAAKAPQRTPAARRASTRKAGGRRTAAPTPKSAGGISDQAVRAATGKDWEAWFAVLDRFDVASKGHKAAASHLHAKHGCPEWWSQMVVVGYEQARGLREKHQRPDGYSVSASRTIGAPVGEAFRAFADARLRRGWLPGVELEVRRATEPRSLRITFVSGAGLSGYEGRPTNLDVNLSSKGPGRCQLQVQHDRLASAADGERMKAFWREALVRLKARLEG